MHKTQTLTRTAMGAVIIALCAWISIPAAVPFTLQTFGIFLVLAVLGARQGTAAILVYILLGLVGLPVFAGFSGGPGALIGPTGGYILGFALIGACCIAAEKLPINGLARLIAGNLAGLAVCYGFGTLWFIQVAAMGGKVYSLPAVLGMCVVPFILPDCIKLALALVVGRRLAQALHLAGTPG